MTQPITVELQSPPPHLFQEPVPVFITLTNLRPEPVSVLLPYPNPNNLGFQCLTEHFAAAKTVEEDAIERTAPITIEPGQNYRATYYLNRYFTFLKEGSGDFEYQLRMLVTCGKPEPASKTETFRGTFSVQLTSASEDQLRDALAAYASQLRSLNRQEKMEGAEALAFVETPLVVPYLLPMLQIDNLEVIGINALARHPGPQTEEAIKSMLGHPDSAVVGAALEEIDRLKIPVSRRRLQDLLTSKNPNVRWVALKWLEAHPDQGDRPLILRLLNDQNAAVRNLAQRYVDALK
jgi:hypothetical protein